MNRLKLAVRSKDVQLRAWLRKAYIWARFGEITEQVKGTAGDNVTAEIEYRGRFGRVVGYWAYGSFDPSYPYQG